MGRGVSAESTPTGIPECAERGRLFDRCRRAPAVRLDGKVCVCGGGGGVTSGRGWGWG